MIVGITFYELTSIRNLMHARITGFRAPGNRPPMERSQRADWQVLGVTRTESHGRKPYAKQSTTRPEICPWRRRSMTKFTSDKGCAVT